VKGVGRLLIIAILLAIPDITDLKNGAVIIYSENGFQRSALIATNDGTRKIAAVVMVCLSNIYDKGK